jgi:ABC-2 type transport system permease protein
VSFPQLRRSLLDEAWTVLWFALGIAAYTLLIAAFWPTAKNNAELFSSYISQFPEAFIKAFGIADITRFEGFIGAELLNFMWPLIVLVFVIMSASSFVAGEIDRGTVEWWLSVPVSRWRLLAAKQVALVVAIAVLAAVTVGLIAAAGRLSNESLSAGGLLGAGLVLASFCVAVGGYATLFSSLFSSRGSAAGLAAGVTLASYLAGVLSGISKDVEWLKYVAITSAYHPQQALSAGGADAGEVAVLLAIGLLCAAVALVVFQRRDANP